MALLFSLAGAATGIAQGGLLARAARGPAASALAWLRILVVGATLTLAARAGHLAAAALGWFAGFVVTVVLVQRRLR